MIIEAGWYWTGDLVVGQQGWKICKQEWSQPKQQGWIRSQCQPHCHLGIRRTWTCQIRSQIDWTTNCRSGPSIGQRDCLSLTATWEPGKTKTFWQNYQFGEKMLIWSAPRDVLIFFCVLIKPSEDDQVQGSSQHVYYSISFSVRSESGWSGVWNKWRLWCWRWLQANISQSASELWAYFDWDGES